MKPQPINIENQRYHVTDLFYCTRYLVKDDNPY